MFLHFFVFSLKTTFKLLDGEGCKFAWIFQEKIQIAVNILVQDFRSLNEREPR